MAINSHWTVSGHAANDASVSSREPWDGRLHDGPKFTVGSRVTTEPRDDRGMKQAAATCFQGPGRRGATKNAFAAFVFNSGAG
jgi:hypothetical protein